MKRLTLLVAAAVAAAIALPRMAMAKTSFTGRIVAVTPTMVAVHDREVIAIAYDSRTQFTKWVTQKPWQQETTLTAEALVPGRLVYVATREDEPLVARWVRIATDMPLTDVTMIVTAPFVAAPSPVVDAPHHAPPAVGQQTPPATADHDMSAMMAECRAMHESMAKMSSMMHMMEMHGHGTDMMPQK